MEKNGQCVYSLNSTLSDQVCIGTDMMDIRSTCAYMAVMLIDETDICIDSLFYCFFVYMYVCGNALLDMSGCNRICCKYIPTVYNDDNVRNVLNGLYI